MKYIDVVKKLAEHVGIEPKDVVWLMHDRDGLENITEFEIFWLGQTNNVPMKISKVVKKKKTRNCSGLSCFNTDSNYDLVWFGRDSSACVFLPKPTQPYAKAGLSKSA